MGKVKPAPEGAKEKETQGNQTRRSPRATPLPEKQGIIAGTPAGNPLPGPSNIERRRLASTLPGGTTNSSVKRPPSTGRKLSALSAHKRRLTTDGTPGAAPSTSKRNQISSPPSKQGPSNETQQQMEGAKSPPATGAPPMTVAEVSFTELKSKIANCRLISPVERVFWFWF